MAKQLNVSLAFTADTSQAKGAIQSLVSELNKLSSTSSLSKDLPITKEIMEAQVAAKQLGDTLESSFNVDTGKLDLAKFTSSLKSSGMSLSDYGNKLSMLGTQGDQAFLKIAQSIAKTQTPLRQSSKLLTEFATTLKNTARWQISSSILHGFMGAVQSAYGYAQNLDKSLNNIRIVTGQSAEQMAAFADQANKAAKALSTTTTEYTNASLIYYQQGLSDEEVAKRTEVTIKMANAAGQSAEIVSDQLTAIWNNFYDGSKSLEYYADVMTALGAATASSTDEIAGGLEKFAAIGETIGLSYEYAASALATITSNTRQSEEVVGTALKTIFARIQGLNLGETLDDGTTLNKYSKALESVGISIFDSTGELKKMDNILNEMADKWNTLSNAQQAALAQTVAGTRQYTQLIALMDNWDNGDNDSMTANLETSYGATGALQEQADIYAESWEASKDRVTASLETIYNSLIDEEFFIKLNDIFSNLLDGLSSVIDAFGGLKGVLSFAGILLVKYFSTDLSQGINNALANFRIFTGAAQEDMATLKKEAYDSAMAMTEGLSDSPAIQGLRASLENTYKLQNDLTAAVKRMSPEQRAVAEEALKTAEHYNNIAVEAGRAAEKAEELYINSLKASQVTRDNAMNTMQQNYDNSVGQSGSELLASARGMKGSASDLGIDTSALDAAIKKYSNALHDEDMDQNSEEFKKIAANLRAELDSIAAKAEETSSRFKAFESSLRDSAQEVVSNQSKFEELKSILVSSGDSGEEFANGVEEAAEAAKAAGGNVEVLEKKLANYRKLLKEGKVGTDEFKKAEKDLRNELDITHVSTEQATSQIAKLANTTEDGRTKVKVLTDEQIKQADAARQSAIANDSAGEAIRVAGEKSAEATAKIKYTKLAYQSIGAALTGTLGAISSCAMGLNSLKSIYDTLNNTELSTFEKTTQIMMSLSMGIPALIGGLKGVGNAFHFVFSAQKKGLTGQIAYLLGAKQEINTSKVLVVSKTGEVLARGAAGDAAVQEALKVEGSTMVTKLDTAATWKNIAAKLIQHWYILVIIAAIGILIGVVYGLVKAYNAEAEAAQKAAEKAKELKETYEETKQAAEDLKSTVDKYKNARDSMSGLKKGTLEYKEALLEANEQALELLNTYEGLARYASRNSEGLIVISNEGLDEILNQQLDLLNRQQIELYKADLDASLTKEISDIVNFARSQGIDEDVANNLLSQITQYFEQNPNINGIGGIDLTMFDAYNNATEEQQASIEKNIDKYNAMARQLMATNTAQELLTDAYLDAEYRLRHPEAETGENGAAKTYDLLYKTLFKKYSAENLSEIAQAKYESNYRNEHFMEYIDEVDGNFYAIQGKLDVEAFKNIHDTGGVEEAEDYRKLKGYDSYETKAHDDNFLNYYLGLFTGEMQDYVFYKDGVEQERISNKDIDDKLFNLMGLIEADAKAAVEVPETMNSLETLMNSLDSTLNIESLRNLFASNGELVDAGMSQETAQYIKDNWSTVTQAFNGYAEDIGFWTEMGYNSYQDYLKVIESWINNRAEKGDEEALTTERITLMKTASDTVSSDLKSGKLTSENAENHSGFIGLVGAAGQLAQLYPNLIDEAETLANTNIVGSEQWIEAYNRVADKINDLDTAAKNSDALQELKDLTGKDYHSFFNKLSPEEQKVFYKVDFDRFQSEDAIKSELARLQGVANETAIEVKISAIETAQGLLKEDGMTTEDWIGIRDSGIEWGKEGVIQFTEFLAMSYEEQSRYLEQIQADQNELLESAKQSTLTNLYKDLQNLSPNGENYKVEYEAIQNNITALEEELMMLEKVNLAKELQDHEIDADEYEDVSEAFRDMSEAGIEGMEALKNNEEAVKDATIRYIELNEAIEDIYNNYDDYVDVLKNVRSATSKADRAMAANTENAKKLKASMAGLLGTTEDMIDADFLAAINPKDFEAAANGNAAAIERIRSQFIELKAEMYGIDFTSLKAELDSFNDGAYIDLNTDTFLNKLIQAAVNAGATATDIESMLSGFGIDADVTPFTEDLWAATQAAQAAGENIANATSFTTEVETADVDTSSEIEVPQYTEIATAQTRVMGYNQVPMSNGFTVATFPSVITTTQKRVDTNTTPQKVEKTETAVGQSVTTGAGTTSKGGVIVKNAHKAPAASRIPSATNTSRPPVNSGGGGGGGGSTKAPSKIDKTHRSDTVERYKEVKDIINELGREMRKLEGEQDELWGKNRINNIQAQIKKIDEETDAIKRQRDEAAAYMNSDMADIQNIASQLGVSFTFNDGYITNYEDVMNTLHNQLAAAEAEYNSFYTRAEGASDAEKNALAEQQTSYEETVLGPLREQLDLLETALGRYDESAETWRNSVDQIEENARKQRALQFQAWTESLELEVGLKQDDIEMFEYLIDLLSDNFYEMAEAIAYMVGTLEQLESGTFGGQMGEYLSLLSTYQTKYQELLDKYAAGEISQAGFVEGLDKLRDEVMSNASALKELDQTMFSYYGDTLAAASDELATYTDLMAHSSSVLEHYSNILNILGKSNDYDKMGVILKGQADTAKHQMEVSEAWYASRKLDAEEQARLYEQAKKDYEAGKITAAELDMYEQKWIDAQTAANEAQDQMLEDAAAWAEALRAVLENKLAKFGQVLENELTRGFGSFDAMMTAMDRANSLQEEYLTTTNQIYETNKLMRKAQQEIDKSTNSVAKQRLKQFATETSALQNKAKLSQYELEIQQAKYELVLAEIALEEAQQSKSTVRLQRDSEGNFGYVYTADQSKLAEAQQQLEDAQNSLYNIGLEGANNYSQKYAETMQEMYDTLTSIQEAWLNGEYETQEEYNKAMTEAQQYYYQKLQDYSSLYQVAITTDSRVVKDAWSSDFSEMTYCTEEWQNHVTSYVGKVTEAFDEWQHSIAGIEEKVGTNLSDIESNVSQLTHSSEDLADTTVNDLIPALNDEILAVHNLTNEYANLRQTILDAIAGHNSLLTSINASKDNEAEGDEDNNNSSSSSSSNNNSSSSNSPSTVTSISSQNSSNNSSSSSSSSNNSSSSSSSSSNSTDISTGQTVTVKASAVKFASGETMWSPVKGNRFKVMAIDGDRVLIGDPSGPNYTASGVTGWVNKKDLEGFDTGGYTGAWGPYGKLALLHEKELVLNQEQTKDLLYTMEFLDKILQTLDLQAVSSQVGGLLSAPYLGAGSGEVLEQNVHIEASFPGVQDRNEIEEAFNMLINQASQYANRK